MNLADEVAKLVIEQYKKLPMKGKPVTRRNGVEEWTVLAGFVGIFPTSIDLISITTGVKSTPNDLISKEGRILHDCHAEILAVRGFNRFLVNECLKVNDGIESDYLIKDGKFKLREGIEFALFVSEAPCGDCSLESLYTEGSEDWEEEESDIIRGRFNYKLKGRIRTKPGRRDSPLSLSKSCSDKLTLMQCKSLLNGLNSEIIELDGFYLNYLILPTDKYNQESFERCFKRIQENNFKILTTSMRIYKEKGTPSPSSLIYLPHESIQESIQKGIKEGFYSKTEYVRRNGESALSKSQLFKLIEPLVNKNKYSEVKSLQYINQKKKGQDQLGNWIKTATDDFSI